MALRDHGTENGSIGWYHKTLGGTDQVGFFAISGVKPIPPNSRDTSGEMQRCDSASHPSVVSYGPYGFHRWDETLQQCSCGRLDAPDPQMGHHQIALRALSRVAAVMEALPYGYILYFEMHDPALEEECVRMSHSDCARTLQEVMRLMVEWDFAYTDLGSNELIAETCHGMLQTWGMPASIRSFLLSDMPAEKVARFLQGDPDAQIRPPVEAIPDLTPELSDWLEQVISQSRPIGGYRG